MGSQRNTIESLSVKRQAWLERLAATMQLGELYDALHADGQAYESVDHWAQGEFHHDVVLRLKGGAEDDALASDLEGRALVVATNCNGGIKELLLFEGLPDRAALWHERCPESPEFAGELPPLVGRVRTKHWFDPCRLLTDSARSEYRPEHRRRQPGGGWEEAG